MHKEILKNPEITRSFIIPVLDYSPHSPYNINTLLKDLEEIHGEVICIFNSHEVFDKLRDHPRIDKYCSNSLNAGVSRSWNIGINMAEGRTAFILNADIHIRSLAVSQLESYLLRLDKAVIAGPQGTILDYQNLRDERYYGKGTFSEPVQVHAVSGFLFAIHLERYIKALLIRAQRAPVDFEKDQAKATEVRKFADGLNRLLKALSPSVTEEKRQAIEDYFWMLEEYKVSVFAQELKTAIPISAKRLQDKLRQIERMV